MTTNMKGKRPQALDVLFLLGLSFLFGHEIDAVTHHEWRLLPILNLFDDEVGYVIFVLAHVPLFTGLVWAVTHQSTRIRFNAQVSTDIVLILHAVLHWSLSGHELYTFHTHLSEFLIFSGGLIGLIHLALMIRMSRMAEVD
ncbi:MAG: hypothetical protein COA62_00820 [Rhodobiaceae bacterium]|nr:MAG: hypothetical protein COA62_00820 [Rhodobiaceae bacterium]